MNWKKYFGKSAIRFNKEDWNLFNALHEGQWRNEMHGPTKNYYNNYRDYCWKDVI